MLKLFAITLSLIALAAIPADAAKKAAKKPPPQCEPYGDEPQMCGTKR
jgi:hypothetical protein